MTRWSSAELHKWPDTSLTSFPVTLCAWSTAAAQVTPSPFSISLLYSHPWLMTMCQTKMRQGLCPNQGLVFAFCTTALEGLCNYYNVIKKLSLLPVMWLWKLLPDCHSREAVNDMNLKVSAAHHGSSHPQPNMEKATPESVCSLEHGVSRSPKSKTSKSKLS